MAGDGDRGGAAEAQFGSDRRDGGDLPLQKRESQEAEARCQGTPERGL